MSLIISKARHLRFASTTGILHTQQSNKAGIRNADYTKFSFSRSTSKTKKRSLSHSKNSSALPSSRNQRNEIRRSLASLISGEILKKEATSVFLRPITLPIPRWVTPRHFSFTISELFGHGSFILVAISYAVDDFLMLRIMAVAGSTAMLFFTYFHPHGRVLWLPFKWNMLFIALNSYRIGKVMYENYLSEQIPKDLKEFRDAHLPLVEQTDFAKIVSIGTIEHFEPGEIILDQDEMSPHVRLIIDGEVDVFRDGTITYSLEEGNFISEAGMHAGLELVGNVKSCALIKSKKSKKTGRRQVRCIKWDRTELMELCSQNATLCRSLQFALSWDIVRKLKAQRMFLLNNRIDNPALWTLKRTEQSDNRYKNILRNILDHHGHLIGHKNNLKKYREIHQIDNDHHLRALKECGWTSEEYDMGFKEKEKGEKRRLTSFFSNTKGN